MVRFTLILGLTALLTGNAVGQENKEGTAAIKLPDVFSKQTVIHSWTEDNSFEMDYRSDGQVKWKNTVSGAYALEKKYDYVELSPTLHQISFKETAKRSDGKEPEQFFVVITYDTSEWEKSKKGKVYGLINKEDKTIVLKGSFKAGQVKAM